MKILFEHVITEAYISVCFNSNSYKISFYAFIVVKLFSYTVVFYFKLNVNMLYSYY